MEASLVLGSLESEHVQISLVGRAHPGATDYWDGNWVRARIEVQVGGFSADVAATLRTDELHRFAQGLQLISDTLTGSARLQSMEEWIDLTVACEPSGRLQVQGEVRCQAGGGNQLTFELHHLDQTHLPAWLSQLAQADATFPVIGRP